MPLAARIAVLCIAVFAAVAGLHASSPAGVSEACLTPKWNSLQLYDGLIYSGRPDLAPLGFAKAHIVDRNIWTDETREEVSLPKLRSTVAPLARGRDIVVLDIEHFPLRGSDEQVRHSVDRLVDAADAAREAARGALVGYYGLVPLSEYWRPLDTSPTGRFNAWRADNRRLMPIAAAVDINMPSLYTHYDDREGWVRQAETLVCEARRMSDKPVVAFIWPEFHPGSVSRGKPVPADYWRLQLDTLARIADGVVIWGGYDLANRRPYQWDGRAPWWQETRHFLDQHRSDRTLRPVG